MVRVLAVALGIWLAYCWKIQERGAPPPRAGAAPRGLYGVLALIFAAALLLEYLPVYWAMERGAAALSQQGLADLVPLHAFLVGALVGYLLADQTLADERMAAQAAERGGDAKPGPPGALRTAIANAGVAVLVLAAVVPPSALLQAVNRLQNLEAPGIKLSFAGTSGTTLAESIRTASTPRSQWTGSTPSAQGGFTPIRLDTMVELTHPPAPAAANRNADVFGNAAAYIAAALGPPHTTSPDRDGLGHTRRAQRDRAFLWQLEQAAPGAERPAAVQERLRALGRAQEGFLAMFAQHVGCLAGFVEATRDRRLVDVRNVHLVQELFVLAHTWSKYEKRVALQNMVAPGGAGRGAPAARDTRGAPVARTRSGAAAAVSAAEAAAAAQAAGQDAPAPAAVEGGGMSTQLGERLRSLRGPLRDFNTWIQRAMREWAATGSPTPEESDAFEACNKADNALPAAEESVAKLSRDDSLLGSGGFTPYVAIFAAQALSALDDHGAAVELLVDWLDDLDEVEAAARRHGRTGHERQAAWFRLQTLIEALVLQKLSENSPDSVPLTVAALRATLDAVFPAVLEKLVDTETMAAWRRGSGACRAADQRWKQGVVLSYLSWIKEYLDSLQRDLADDPSRLTSQDLRRTGLLADIDMECFDWILGDPAGLAAERAASRVEFTTSAAAVRVLEHEASAVWGASAEERSNRLQRTAMELREAIAGLEATEQRDRSFAQPLQAGTLRRLVFPDPRRDMLVNARVVLKRIEALRKQM